MCIVFVNILAIGTLLPIFKYYPEFALEQEIFLLKNFCLTDVFTICNTISAACKFWALESLYVAIAAPYLLINGEYHARNERV